MTRYASQQNTLLLITISILYLVLVSVEGKYEDTAYLKQKVHDPLMVVVQTPNGNGESDDGELRTAATPLSVLVGYAHRCPPKAAGIVLPKPQPTEHGPGWLLYESHEAISEALNDTTSKSLNCHDNQPRQLCQVWTDDAVWSSTSKVHMDLPTDEHLTTRPLDGWEVADRYGYDAPPLLGWSHQRHLPGHLVTRDSAVTGAVTTIQTKFGPRLIGDDGGIRLHHPSHYDIHTSADPLYHFLCSDQMVQPQQRDWTDATLTSFRRASDLAQRRIVAVGDLHGDLSNTLKVLEMSGVIDSQLHWAGGNNTIFVQTGDVVDRGADTIELYRLMERLREEALAAGGRVVQILGNHELMNLSGDLRYVTPEDHATFDSFDHRQRAFNRFGSIGLRLFQLHLVHRVGDSVFAHGGIDEPWAKKGTRAMNRETTDELPRYVSEPDLYQRYNKWPIFGDSGPAWYRDFALKSEAEVCPRLRRALRLMGAERMVVGHTFQDNGKVLSRCDGRFFVIDVGISKSYFGFLGALETNHCGNVTAIYPTGRVLLKQGTVSPCA